MANQENRTRNEEEALRVSGRSGPVSFEEAMQEWEQEMEQVFEANRAAEQLSAEDFAVRINAKAE